MSASERLRALDGAMTPAGWYDDAHYPEGIYSGKPTDHWDYYLNTEDTEGVVALRNALPLLADAIARLEDVPYAITMALQWTLLPSDVPSTQHEALKRHREDLARLYDEAIAALTALREALNDD